MCERVFGSRSNFQGGRWEKFLGKLSSGNRGWKAFSIAGAASGVPVVPSYRDNWFLFCAHSSSLPRSRPINYIRPKFISPIDHDFTRQSGKKKSNLLLFRPSPRAGIDRVARRTRWSEWKYGNLMVKHCKSGTTTGSFFFLLARKKTQYHSIKAASLPHGQILTIYCRGSFFTLSPSCSVGIPTNSLFVDVGFCLNLTFRSCK